MSTQNTWVWFLSHLSGHFILVKVNKRSETNLTYIDSEIKIHETVLKKFVVKSNNFLKLLTGKIGSLWLRCKTESVQFLLLTDNLLYEITVKKGIRRLEKIKIISLILNVHTPQPYPPFPSLYSHLFWKDFH